MTYHPGSNTRVSLLEQELLTLLKHMTLTPCFLLVLMLLNLFFLHSIFSTTVCLSVLFLLAIMSSVLQFTTSDYPSGIFKLFVQWKHDTYNDLCKEQTRFTEHRRKTLQDVLHWDTIKITSILEMKKVNNDFFFLNALNMWWLDISAHLYLIVLIVICMYIFTLPYISLCVNCLL